MAQLKLPEKVRLRLIALYQARQMAEVALQGPTATALEFLGLDPALPHQINFDTGIVTPAAGSDAELPEPTPLRKVEDLAEAAPDEPAPPTDPDLVEAAPAEPEPSEPPAPLS